MPAQCSARKGDGFGSAADSASHDENVYACQALQVLTPLDIELESRYLWRIVYEDQIDSMRFQDGRQLG